MVVTGRRWISDSPRSPRSMPVRNSQYCSDIGLIQTPTGPRMLAISASVLVADAHELHRVSRDPHQREDEDGHPEQRDEHLEKSDYQLAPHALPSTDVAAVDTDRRAAVHQFPFRPCA